jgi:NitT/TauT family transport system permease protein
VTRRRIALEWAAIAGVVLVAWELAVRQGLLGTTVVAAPWDIAQSMVELAGDSQVRADFFEVIFYILVAFVLGSVAGLLLGLVLGTSRYIYRVFYPFLLVWFSTPSLIFIPIMILLFGVGGQLKIAYGVLAAIPSMAVTVAAGVQMVDARLSHTARSLGAGRLQIAWSVTLPATVPSVMTGLRYALNHVLLGVVLAELFASSAGLGLTIELYSAALLTDHVYALLFSLAVASVLLAVALARWERYVMRWQGRASGRTGVAA